MKKIKLFICCIIVFAISFLFTSNVKASDKIYKDRSLELHGQIAQKYKFFLDDNTYNENDFYFDGYVTDSYGNTYYNDDIIIELNYYYANLLYVRGAIKIKNTNLMQEFDIDKVKKIEYVEFNPDLKLDIDKNFLVIQGQNLVIPKKYIKLTDSNGRKVSCFYELKYSKNIKKLKAGTHKITIFLSECKNNTREYNDGSTEITIKVLPKFKIKATKNSITITSKDNTDYEYSLNNKDWSNDSTFPYLEKNKRYTIYIRESELANEYVSTKINVRTK